MEIKKFLIGEDAKLAEATLSIRRVVFIDEQKVDPEIEFEYESESVHFLLIDEGIPVSTGRYRITDKGIKLERFATLAQYRNRGYGSVILNEILKTVMPMDREIYLNAQSGAIPFYKKHGFVVKGDRFYEADIEHFKMILENK